MKDLLNGWGLTAATFLPLAGAAVMLAIPKASETLHKLVAVITSVAVFGIVVTIATYFDFDNGTKLQFVVDKSWIDVINSR